MATVFSRHIWNFGLVVFGDVARWTSPHSHVEKYGVASGWYGALLAAFNDFVVADFGLCKKLCAFGTTGIRDDW